MKDEDAERIIVELTLIQRTLVTFSDNLLWGALIIFVAIFFNTCSHH